MGGRSCGPRGRAAPKTTATALACVLACVLASCVAQQRYRFCVVTDENRPAMFSKLCPLLKGDGSRAECVYGNSRLDCLRLISKNEADFGIFQPEDLLVARKDRAGDFVITHNIQNFQTEYEYKLVVIIRKSANINSLRDLRNKNLCHPGHGYETDWTEVEGRFFEERVVPQSCDSELTVNENFIKSSASFFGAACKAGPWVPDAKLDAVLKNKYSILCSLCDRPKLCSKLDKYWGRTGPLYCLTDGYGDVAWARLDDTKAHFGLLPDTVSVANSDEYSFLCDDGSQVPINFSMPCSWLERPWPAIMAQRKAAVGIQKLIASLKSNPDGNWQQAIRQLLDANRFELSPLSTTKIPEDYLRSVTGFLSANSIIHCERTVKLCTYSALENAKCNWISEAAKANGVKPYIICEEQDSVEKCMNAVNMESSDAVLVESDFLAIAMRKYNLTSMLYEHVSSTSSSYNIAAVVLATSLIRNLQDLKGKRACFSRYDGAGWNTALYMLKSYKLLSPSICPYAAAIGMFFPEVCIPELNSNFSESVHLNNICKDSISSTKFHNEEGAVQCLRSGRGDVAFVSKHIIFNQSDHKNWPSSQKHKEFVIICPPNNTKECSLSRTAPGQIMVKKDASLVKLRELKMVLEHISHLFGKYSKQQKQAFQIFAPFDGHKNVIFHDETQRLEDVYFSESYVPKYEDIVVDTKVCSLASLNIAGSFQSIFISIVFLYNLV